MLGEEALDMAESQELDYPEILQEALRDAVRRILIRVAAEGLPGQHHFYIAFRTDQPGVGMPLFLRQRHPEEMAVVLQNQFWNLVVDEDSFAVDLSFDGSSHTIRVPFAALTTFVDPSVEFALRFGVAGTAAPEEPEAIEAPAVPEVEEAPVAGVIRFDPSRRRFVRTVLP
jgi:hypothetical protein